MTDRTSEKHPSFPPAADLIDLEVDTYEKTGVERALRLRVLLEKADGVEFRKQTTWDLVVSEEDLKEIVQKMNEALEQLT